MKSLLEKFFSNIHVPNTYIQFGTLDRVLFYKGDIIHFLSLFQDSNLYFLAGVSKDKYKQAPHFRNTNNDDVLHKKHTFFDFDIRKNKPEITDDEIKREAKHIVENLSTHSIYSNWGSIVFTGNGLHLYYFSESPVEVDNKQYSLGYVHHAKEISKIIGIEADLQCQNTGRIARLPGSYNNKNGRHTLVEVLQLREVKSLLLENIMAYKEPIRELSSTSNNQVHFGAPKEVDKDKYISVQEVLDFVHNSPIKQLFDTFGVAYTRDNSVIIDGQITSAKINEKENYVTRFSGKEGSGDFLKVLEAVMHISFKEAIAIVANKCFGKEILWSIEDEKVFSKLEEIQTRIQTKTDITQRFLTPRGKNPKTWGVSAIDEQFGNVRNGEYILFLGEAGAGKTSFTTHMAIENAKRGVRCIFISLEMAKENLEDRYVELYAGITQKDRETAKYTERQLERMRVAIQELQNDNLVFVDMVDLGDRKRDWNLIKELIHNYDIAFIDNFSKIVPRDSKEEITAQSQISEDIAQWIEETKKTIVMLHHYSKKNGNTRGMEARGSQKLIDDISVHVSIERNDENGGVKFEVRKGRYIPVGKSNIVFKNGKFFASEEIFPPEDAKKKLGENFSF